MNNFFVCNTLNLIFSSFTLLLGATIIKFSSHYLAWSEKPSRFTQNLLLFFTSLLLFTNSDYCIISIINLLFANIFFAFLVGHFTRFKPAQKSKVILIKTGLKTTLFLTVGWLLLYYDQGIHQWSQFNTINFTSISAIALLCFIVGSCLQSAMYPFCNWLLATVNGPTPSSACMHAGLINAGGILLIKSAPALVKISFLLQIVSFIGTITILVGTICKLINTSEKGMIVYSTIAQMGFMFLQCGLGLFPAAFAHLLWHGGFKAYLFLASPSAAQKEHQTMLQPPFVQLIIAASIGASTAALFGFITTNHILPNNTNLVLNIVAFIGLTQWALTWLQKLNVLTILKSFFATLVASLTYSFSIKVIEHALLPMHLEHSQPLSMFHYGIIFLLFGSWLISLWPKKISASQWYLSWYVYWINNSTPNQQLTGVEYE